MNIICLDGIKSFIGKNKVVLNNSDKEISIYDLKTRKSKKLDLKILIYSVIFNKDKIFIISFDYCIYVVNGNICEFLDFTNHLIVLNIANYEKNYLYHFNIKRFMYKCDELITIEKTKGINNFYCGGKKILYYIENSIFLKNIYGESKIELKSENEINGCCYDEKNEIIYGFTKLFKKEKCRIIYYDIKKNKKGNIFFFCKFNNNEITEINIENECLVVYSKKRKVYIKNKKILLDERICFIEKDKLYIPFTKIEFNLLFTNLPYELISIIFSYLNI